MPLHMVIRWIGVWGILAGVLCLEGWGSQPCARITESRKAELSHYVQQKYKLPDSRSLHVAEVTDLEGCYRKVHFVSDELAGPELSLYLSPDLRFLSTNLLDSHVDPVGEERRAYKELVTGLARTDRPSIGPADAPVTIAVFSDFQCPFCKKEAEILQSEVSAHEPRQVRLVFRQFPSQGHPWARLAAEVTTCAYLQNSGAFWKMHDFLFRHQDELTMNNFYKLLWGDGLMEGLDRAELEGCMTKGGASEIIEEDIRFAQAQQIRVTPTLFVNHHRVEGAANAENIRTLVRQALRDLPEHSKN